MRLHLLFVICFIFLDCHSQSLTSFKENNKYGFKTQEGKIAIAPIYDGVGWRFCHGVIAVEKDHKLAVINKKGEHLTPFKYDAIHDFESNGPVGAEIGSYWGYIDSTGKEVIPFIYDNVFMFRGEFAAVKRKNKWGVIDQKNNIIIPLIYDELDFTTVNQNAIVVTINHRTGAINHNNIPIIPFIYDEIEPCKEGLFLAVDQHYKVGYIDANNNMIIPFIYDYDFTSQSGFKNGIAPLKYHKKWGFIDKKGETVIPFKYDDIGAFNNGFAGVQRANFFGYIDSTGKELLIEDYERNEVSNFEISTHPAILPDNSCLLKTWGESKDPPWTMENLLNNFLHSFIYEPRTYYREDNIKQIIACMGLPISGSGNYSERFIWPDYESWIKFKKETIYKIIGNETYRMAAWQWMAPYYKKLFPILHPFHQNIYKEIAVYMKDYINNYDEEKVIAYLKSDEENFAYKNMNGKPDPYRKLSAFVDRLLLIHKAITYREAKKWINIIADEVATW